MAEYCRDCAIKYLGFSEDELRGAKFSRKPDLCEGCAEYKPVLVSVCPNNKWEKIYRAMLNYALRNNDEGGD